MRTYPVQARIDSAGTPMQLLQGSEFGFRVLRLTGAAGATIIPGYGFNTTAFGSGVLQSDFINSGPGPIPVCLEVNRELDPASHQGLVSTKRAAGASQTVVVTDGGWQPVPCRQWRIANSQPFNFLAQQFGMYLVLMADSPEEMNSGNVDVRKTYADDGQYAVTQEFLATAGASQPTLVVGKQGPGGVRVNAVCGLTKAVIQNMGPNPIAIGVERWIDIGNAYSTATILMGAGLILGPAAAGVPASTLILEDLGDGISIVIASTVLQLAGAGTRVVTFFGPGYRG